MMAYRIAYCKINYPLAYYAAYFSIRADAFSYEIMCQGREKLDYYMKDYKRRSDTLTKKEQDTMKDMKIVQGDVCPWVLRFVPVDIYKAKSKKCFRSWDGKLMPSFASIEGWEIKLRRQSKRRERTDRICHWMISGSGRKSARQ